MTKKNEETQWISGVCKASTELAILFDFGLKDLVWVPRSLIIDYTEEDFQHGDSLEVELPLWFCEEKDLF